MTSISIISIRRTLHRAAMLGALVLVAGPPILLSQQMSIVDSPHNLSAQGPGNIHATSEEQVCIFCHTPHHASTVRPLWNRAMYLGSYTPYQSNSLKALPGQPTGSSKLCLSCHDGTIALGNVLSRTQEIPMSGGVTRMPEGAAHLGTDLSDDHPISFPYDNALMQKDPSLKNPAGFPREVKLDLNLELQCVSCHDPHNNQYGKFLVMDNTASQLCNACHNQGTTTVTGHNNCAACHQSHTAPSGPYLLRGKTVTATCTASTCHGAQATQPRLNIATDIARFDHHDTNTAVAVKDHVPNESVCTDCHDPHTMGNGSVPVAPAISPRMGKISGINALGSAVSPAVYEYQLCFKCHGDQAANMVTLIPRRIAQPNKRLQFNTTAISFHPVEVAGKNNYVPSLKPGLSAGTIVYCSDCHASDTSPAGGGTGPRGTHGSSNPRLLAANYTTADGTSESATAYALCYKCHDRNAFASETPFGANTPFKPHFRHIYGENTPCSVCHDSHGISSGQGTPTGNAHLINFDTSIVQPEPSTHQIAYTRTGTNSGTCTLFCHKTHLNRPYGNASGPPQPLALPAVRQSSPGISAPSPRKAR